MKEQMIASEWDSAKNGLFNLYINNKPNLAGKIKIFLWNLILFPIVKISWRDKQ